MAGRPPVLPGPDGLARLRRKHQRNKCPVRGCSGHKHTYKEIARAWGVSESAVYQAMRKAGLTDEGSRVTHTDTIPWTLRQEDWYTPTAMRLRILGQIRRGDDIAEEKRRMVIKWVYEMINDQRVVVYDKSLGWSTSEWVPGDAEIIRPPDTAVPEVYSHPDDRKIWAQRGVPATFRRNIIAKRQAEGYSVTLDSVLQPRDLK